jgi:hypothetical protein
MTKQAVRSDSSAIAWRAYQIDRWREAHAVTQP